MCHSVGITMEITPDVDEELVAKSLAELADADYQTHVWRGRVPTVSSSLVASYAALFGESGLAAALDDGPVFSAQTDERLLRLRELLEAIDGRQPIDRLLRDPSLAAVRALSADVLRDLGVTEVTKRGLPELDLPRETPPWSDRARLALAAGVGVAVLVALVIVFQPQPRCDNPVDTTTVSASACH